MANIQTYPQQIYPISGDVQSHVGNPKVTVTGIQSTPVLAQLPLNGQLLIYDSATNNYIPGDPIVSGPNQPGTAPTVNPVQVAGIDDGNLVREVRTDSYGSLRSLSIEEKLDQLIYLLRALLAATITDKQVDDADFTADNFTDIPSGG
jgi:hypothetical protein